MNNNSLLHYISLHKKLFKVAKSLKFKTSKPLNGAQIYRS